MFLCTLATRNPTSPWANLKNRPKSWTYLQFVGGSDFFAEMDSARFELSKSVCWERKLASKVVEKVLRSGRFSPCACSLAAEPQRSFSFLFYARCHSDCPSQAMLDACVRAFADVLSMSMTLCFGILLKCFEVFKLPLCSPIMERIILDLTAVWEHVQGGETVSEAVVAIEEN